MKNKLHFLFIFFIFAISTSFSHQSQINVWPKPVKISWPSPQVSLISPSFKIISPYIHKHFQISIARYTTLIQSERHEFIRATHTYNTSSSSISSYPPLNFLHISIQDYSSPLQHGVDETYSLKITTNGTSYLLAETIWGAMHGLETFSQLVYIQNNQLTVPVNLYIEDGPMFAHRGVMLDTSRNYFPPKDIMRTIRGMSANKLNVFHWHITDSHSFPIALPSEPELANRGSYGARMQYSVDDVREIVEYGLQHGVRVVPEIDTPGLFPDIVTCEDMFWMPPGSAWPDRLATEPGTGQLNPLNPNTYKVVKNIIDDITTLFLDNFYHAGADEVIPNCWKTDPLIQAHVFNNGTLDEILEVYINETYPYIRSRNRTVVYWEDVLINQS